MAETLSEDVLVKDFDPSKYVNIKIKECKGVDDLLHQRENILKLSEETNGLLKKNVYKNYTQFIETAREISHVESEMYQLSHMLTEQQSVLASMLDSSNSPQESILHNRENETDEETNKNLSLLLEKVEGCATIIEVRGRVVLHSGELNELNISDWKPFQTVYCVLLNDSIMIATKIEDSRGPLQYRYQNLYELDNLAVVNVKDEINAKGVFKILMFPEARIFQCSSTISKKDWLAHIEKAKDKRFNSLKWESILSEILDSSSEDEDNPFGENNEVENAENLEMPEWLVELSEELDVHIALREFEKAVELIQRAYNHFASFSRSVKIKDAKMKVDKRAQQLVNILTDELKASSECLLQGDPRSAKQAVNVLVKLKKSSKACNLFLKRSSAILKQNIKQQKSEGATTLYIEKLCSVFFTSIANVGKDFIRAFATKNSCVSAFVLWSKIQLEQFVLIFSKHVFTPQVNASIATECISCARLHCDKLTEFGLDLSFVLNDLLFSHVERLVIEMRDKLLEAIKLRTNDDKWRPQNHQNVTNLKKVVDDLKEMGFQSIESYTYDECWLALTANTTAFGKMYLHFLDDLLKLHTLTIHSLINEALYVTFHTHIAHVNNAFQNNISDRQFILKNVTFLLEVLRLSESRYLNKLKCTLPQMIDLKNDLNKLVAFSNRTSFTKYSSTAYI